MMRKYAVLMPMMCFILGLTGCSQTPAAETKVDVSVTASESAEAAGAAEASEPAEESVAAEASEPTEESVAAAEEANGAPQESKSPYFSNFNSEHKADGFQTSGTIHQSNNKKGKLVELNASQDSMIHVTGYLKKKSGDIKLIYAGPDQKEHVITENNNPDIDVDIQAAAGYSSIYFMGDQAVYDFDLLFGKADGVSYQP